MSKLSYFLFLASVILAIPPGISAAQSSAGRNVSLEYLERGFHLDGESTLSSGGTGFWATPEGKRRYAQNQLNRFYEKVDELVELGSEDWTTLHEPSVERRSDDLEDVSGDILKFFEWAYGGESIEANALPDESVLERLARITTLIRGVLPAMSTMTTGAVLNSEAFLQARRDLAEIKALSRAVRD